MHVTPTQRYENFLHQQKHMDIRQIIRLRKQYLTSRPPWCRPLYGYVCAIPILFVALFIPVLLQQFIHPLIFPAVFVTLALALISILWGIGPALFGLVMGLLGLDFYFIPPIGELNLLNWWTIAQLCPFFFSSVILVLLTGQRERAHLNGYQDRQELHQYAEELETATDYVEQVKRERDTFLLMASHELKTPVTAIRGYAELLRRRLRRKTTWRDTKDLEAALQRIHEQTIRLTALIDRLLDVKTFRSHGRALSKSQCELNQLCQQVIEDQRFLTAREVVFYPSVEPLELRIDVHGIAQVILNLVSNALKYSSPDKPVEICVSWNDQRALLGVQDHGFGIAPDELPHIFEMYYRAPRARSSTASGLAGHLSRYCQSARGTYLV